MILVVNQAIINLGVVRKIYSRIQLNNKCSDSSKAHITSNYIYAKKMVKKIQLLLESKKGYVSISNIIFL